MNGGRLTVKAGHCFACDRPIEEGYLVGCADEQDVGVGPECYAKIRKAGEAGYQPSLGGPRLYLLQFAFEMRRAGRLALSQERNDGSLKTESGS